MCFVSAPFGVHFSQEAVPQISVCRAVCAGGEIREGARSAPCMEAGLTRAQG